ncbi:hypothetical protein MicloDRAFT_00060760 [Microvirga lotononidis]|uniref:Transposase IS701-like DDE domain-containing protein n=1 Tax=Microvirga lotononidis TaxID=864069 RepID=I4YN08_9HYPH|nr:hypothetical protein MicloDRAFT_00060760 [Microvirga lotononidis]
MPVPLVLRLFLPETWIKDPERLQRAGVPEAFWGERSEPETALAELQRVMQAGVSFGAVLADAGYGISAPFRQALSALGLRWAVGTVRIQKVYPADVQMIASATTRGRPRKTLLPDAEAASAEAMLASAPWRRVTWRRGTKGPLQAKFAADREAAATLGAGVSRSACARDASRFFHSASTLDRRAHLRVADPQPAFSEGLGAPLGYHRDVDLPRDEPPHDQEISPCSHLNFRTSSSLLPCRAKRRRFPCQPLNVDLTPKGNHARKALWCAATELCPYSTR